MEYRDLVTVDEVRAATGWTDSDYTDAEIGTMITDVSVAIESLLGHGFPYENDAEFEFFGGGNSLIELYGFPMPLRGEPAEVNGYAFDSGVYALYPQYGGFYDELSLRIGVFPENFSVKILGNWGWEEIPADVKVVAIRLIRRYAADESFAAAVSGVVTVTRGIHKVDIGEGRASVTFEDPSSGSASSVKSLIGSVAGKVIKRYRRFRIGAVV